MFHDAQGALMRNNLAVGILALTISSIGVVASAAPSASSEATGCWDVYNLSGSRQLGVTASAGVLPRDCTPAPDCKFEYRAGDGKRTRWLIPYGADPKTACRDAAPVKAQPTSSTAGTVLTAPATPTTLSSPPPPLASTAPVAPITPTTAPTTPTTSTTPAPTTSTTPAPTTSTTSSADDFVDLRADAGRSGDASVCDSGSWVDVGWVDLAES